MREALSLINQTLDEVLAEQEGDFDAETRWALAWFEQSGFDEGEYGVAETLSTAKNTSVAGMVEAGILDAAAGRVRLLRPNELPDEWDPEKDQRLTAWESVHHLVRVLDQGEETAAELMAKLGYKAEAARELAYRLYRICDQKEPLPGSVGLQRSGAELAGDGQANPSGHIEPSKASCSDRSKTMAITNQERVGKAMESLKAGLAPFAAREFGSRYKDEAVRELQHILGEPIRDPRTPLSPHGCRGIAEGHVGFVE